MWVQNRSCHLTIVKVSAVNWDGPLIHVEILRYIHSRQSGITQSVLEGYMNDRSGRGKEDV